ncbi:MAG TPA: hypothetical protein VF297_32380 [Pyrinomonadaceae bacterium]
MKQKKNTAPRAPKPTSEQQQTARTLQLLYADEIEVSPGTRRRISLYLNRLLRDTGTPKKGLPRHELYLLAVAKPDANLTYDSWVQPLCRDAWQEHANSTPERIRSHLCLTYTGRPNASDMQMIDALLALARFQMTLRPAGLDLAQTIYKASVQAWRKSRAAYKDNELPGILADAARVLHIKAVQVADGKVPGTGYVRDFFTRGETNLARWYGEGEAGEAAADDETPAAHAGGTFECQDEAPAPVVDLLCWIQSHPRTARNLLFAEKQ